MQFGTYCGYSYPVRTYRAYCYEAFSGGPLCPNQYRDLGAAYVVADSDTGTYYSGSFCPAPECNDFAIEWNPCALLS